METDKNNGFLYVYMYTHTYQLYIKIFLLQDKKTVIILRYNNDMICNHDDSIKLSSSIVNLTLNV